MSIRGDMAVIQVFGDFVEKSGECGEYLKIGFSPSSIPIQQRWRTNGLSADFLADYLSTFFPGQDPASAKRQAEMKDAVSYVANELLENAMKFSYAHCQHSITIRIHLEATEIQFYVTNSVDMQHVGRFQCFIRDILTGDVSELYMQQLLQT